LTPLSAAASQVPSIDKLDTNHPSAQCLQPSFAEAALSSYGGTPKTIREVGRLRRQKGSLAVPYDYEANYRRYISGSNA
jgi:hypothetical protein